MPRVLRSRPPGPEAGRILQVWLAAGLLALLGAGCTSDPTGPVGSALVENPISAQLDTLTVYDLASYSALEIEDRNLPLYKRQTLYLGHQVVDGDSTSSAILANYDFTDVYDEDFPPEAFTLANIQSVNLQLLMLNHHAKVDTFNHVEYTAKYYDLRVLQEPFQQEDFPGPVPASDFPEGWVPPLLTESGAQAILPINPANILNWLAAADTVGLLIQEYTFLPSDPGLVGFSSRELSRTSGAGQLDDYGEYTSVGPTIEITFADPELGVLLIKPIADTSTFHKVAAPPTDPADGLVLRTCLRNYPLLDFDLSELPANALINRAVLSLTNDPRASFGPPESIVVAELAGEYLTPLDGLSLVELETRSHRVIGKTGVYPGALTTTTLHFTVTTAIQRMINGVYEGRRGLVLCAGEDFFPNYDLLSIDPDFYFGEFHFLGTAAGPDQRPRLRITYSLIEDLQEVEQ